MKEPPEPADEDARVSSLRSLLILDTPAEERFDRLTRLAREAFRVPIALVSVVDEHRQWFKSAQGLAVAETPRAVSFCGHAILQEAPLVVSDATLDPRFVDNPLVTGSPEMRFYAGHPIKAPDGKAIGTICVIDRSAREFSDHELGLLADLAALVEHELALFAFSESVRDLLQRLSDAERKAATDSLTRLWNREAALALLGMEHARAARAGTPLGVFMVDVDHFKAVNDEHGHQAGDEVLRTVAQRLRSALRPYDVIGRYGGEEFVVVALGCNRECVERLAERTRAAVGANAVRVGLRNLPVSVSIGVAWAEDAAAHDPDALVALADGALYRAKAAGRNRVVVDARARAAAPVGEDKR